MESPEDAVAIMHSQINPPTPTAVHVFQSLFHGKPIFVKNTQNDILWKVDGNTIELVDPYRCSIELAGVGSRARGVLVLSLRLPV